MVEILLRHSGPILSTDLINLFTHVCVFLSIFTVSSWFNCCRPLCLYEHCSESGRRGLRTVFCTVRTRGWTGCCRPPRYGWSGPRPGAHEQVLQVLSAQLARFPSGLQIEENISRSVLHMVGSLHSQSSTKPHKTNAEVATKIWKNKLYILLKLCDVLYYQFTVKALK